MKSQRKERCSNWREHLLLIILTVMNIVGQAMQIVTVVLWFATVDPDLQNTMGFSVLIATSIPPCIVFGLVIVVRWLQKCKIFKHGHPFWYGWREFGLCSIIGIFNALSQLLFFYSSDSTRTSAILQPILSSATVFYSIPLTKWILKDNKKYFSLLPVVSLSTVLVGLCIGLIPGIIAIVHGEADFGGALYWPFIYLLSYAPVSTYNVLQQYLLLDFAKRHPEGSPSRDYISETLYIVFWTTLWLLIGSALMFWMDLIPGFGSNGSLKGFWSSFVLGMDCGFGVISDPTICQGTPLYTYLYAVGYVLSYWASARLNEQSANYTMLSQVCVSPLAVCFWLVFPWLNPSPTPQPLWSIMPALVLATVGLIMWRAWEIRVEAAEQKMQYKQDKEIGDISSHDDDNNADEETPLLTHTESLIN